jgi:hypothetical protein
LIATPLAAAPFAVQLGEAKIGLDAPPGFADTGFTGSPRLQELGEALTSASNRILLFAISDADLRRFMVGDPLELRRYMIVVTPRGLERERVTESAFKLFVNDAVQGLGQPAGSADYPKYLDSRPTGAVSLLAELRKDADVVSVLQGARSKGGFFERSKYLLSTTTLMLVRGKALNLSVYTQYDDPADLEWIRVTTARWIEELKRLNSR